MPLNEKSNVFIIDDHPAIREGIARLIDATDDLRVCGEAGDKTEALDRLDACRPDAVLLDISLGDQCSSGLDLIADIRGRFGDIPVLILSMHPAAVYAEHARKAGARGYLTKQEPVTNILKALRAVLAGNACFDGQIHESQDGKTPVEGPLSLLGQREFEVFRLVGRGMSSRSIAQALSLSVKTIENHKANICKKLSLPSAEALTVMAVAAQRVVEGI